jgi:allophanate hydrolase subunit 1
MDQVHSFSQVLVKYTMYSVAFKSIQDTLDRYCTTTTNANNPTTNAYQLAEAASKISLLPPD